MAVVSLNSLPLGYRFRPSDEELIDFYLRLKINGNNNEVRVIGEIDVCKWEPWDLPGLSVIPTKDLEWFFFCPQDRKHPNGNRSNRATGAGYWKATGKDRKIKSGNNLIGMKKTLVFYTGRAPKAKRTNWVMHEYRAITDDLDGSHPGQSVYVICRLFKKQDASVEVSHCEKVEPAESSPASEKSSPDDNISELPLPEASPVLEIQDDKHLTSVECSHLSDLKTDDMQGLVECQNNNSVASGEKDQMAEYLTAANEMDSFTIEDFNVINESIEDLFLPLNTTVPNEIGSSYMNYPVTDNSSKSYKEEVQFSHESEADFTEFVDSVLNTDGYSLNETGSQRNSTIESELPKNTAVVKESGSCYNAEVAQNLPEPDFTRSLGSWENIIVEDLLQVERVREEINYSVSDHSFLRSFLHLPFHEQDAFSAGSTTGQLHNVINSHDESNEHKDADSNYGDGTGIRIRPRPPPPPRPPILDSSTQGDAPRRIRLQSMPQVMPCSKVSRALSCMPEEQESKPNIIEGEKAEAEESAAGVYAAIGASDEPQKRSHFESSENINISEELATNDSAEERSNNIILMGKQVSKASRGQRSLWTFSVMFGVAAVVVILAVLVSIVRGVV